MKQNYSLLTALLTCLTLMFGLAGYAGAHQAVPLLDSDGAAITDSTGTNSAAAYSSATTCGRCHTYAEIEQHSYHVQLGANEQKGWMAYNPNSSDKYKKGPATKGKSWVQSPGHAGKW